jgi:hypothetical protein
MNVIVIQNQNKFCIKHTKYWIFKYWGYDVGGAYGWGFIPDWLDLNTLKTQFKLLTGKEYNL